MPKPKDESKSQVEMLISEIKDLRKEIDELKANQTPVARKAAGRPRGDVYYVLLGIPSEGFPPQAITCAKILATAKNVNHIPESEAMRLIVEAHNGGILRTTQDAWHIFQYYRARLIEGDFLQMKTL